MFERFTKDAREAVVQAQEEARALGAERIGTEHVLLGAIREPDAIAARALSSLGVDHRAVLAGVRTLPGHAIDADALAGVGIDLDAVRAQVEATFGPGALDSVTAAPAAGKAGHRPFDAEAKKLLELSLREAIRYKHRRIDSGHLLLAIVRLDRSTAHRVLDALGLSSDDVCASVDAAWADVPVG